MERLRTPDARPPSESALAQLYRGELARSDRWRNRLDTTTNWAITVTGLVVSYGYANPHRSHVIILVGLWLVLTFLLMEASRYRYYDLWIRRVRLLEDGFWVPLIREEPLDRDALRELAVEMARPRILISFRSAVATRIGRAYGAILLVLGIMWMITLGSYPTSARGGQELVTRAAVGFVPGVVVVTLVALIFVLLLVIYLSERAHTPPVGEVQRRRPPPDRAPWDSPRRTEEDTLTRPLRHQKPPKRPHPPDGGGEP